MNFNFSIFNLIYNDVAEPWQLGFQDSATPGFTGIEILHNTVGFYLIVICVSVFWMIFSICSNDVMARTSSMLMKRI